MFYNNSLYRAYGSNCSYFTIKNNFYSSFGISFYCNARVVLNNSF